MKEFKDILADWKGDRGLVDTGQLLGVSAATVHYWLLGDRLPPLTRLPVLAEAFGMPLDVLRDLITAERTTRQQADTAVHRALPALKPGATTAQILAAAEAACEAAYAAADAAQAKLDAATDPQEIADADAVCSAAFAMADAAAAALATATKAHANSLSTVAERAVAEAALGQIEARRARIHAGIPIHTREQTEAWIATQRPAPKPPGEGG